MGHECSAWQICPPTLRSRGLRFLGHSFRKWILYRPRHFSFRLQTFRKHTVRCLLPKVRSDETWRGSTATKDLDLGAEDHVGVDVYSHVHVFTHRAPNANTASVPFSCEQGDIVAPNSHLLDVLRDSATEPVVIATGDIFLHHWCASLGPTWKITPVWSLTTSECVVSAIMSTNFSDCLRTTLM